MSFIKLGPCQFSFMQAVILIRPNAKGFTPHLCCVPIAKTFTRCSYKLSVHVLFCIFVFTWIRSGNVWGLKNVVSWIRKKSCHNFVFHYVSMQPMSFCFRQINFYTHFYFKLEGKKGRWKMKGAWFNSWNKCSWSLLTLLLIFLFFSTWKLEVTNGGASLHALLLPCWAPFSHPHSSPCLALQFPMGFYGHEEKNRGQDNDKFGVDMVWI